MSTVDRKITTTEIAQLTGVSTAAVSQWRKRHNDTFPEAIPGKGRAILFNRADVLTWLKNNNRPIRQKGGITNSLRGHVEASQYGPTLLFLAACASVDSLGDLPTPLRDRVEDLFSTQGIRELYADLADKYTAQEMLDAAEDTFAQTAEGGDYSTPAILTTLIADLVPTAPQAVLDFACGAGGTLDAIQHRFPQATFSGNDVSATSLALAQARAITGNWTATWTHQDVLQPSTLPAASFDLVCSNPPFGLAVDKARLEEQPDRWPYGVPGRNDDTKWLQLAHHVLTDGGIGIINVTHAALSTRHTTSALPAMVADGSLLAVISLPENLFANTGIPSALVIFTKNPTTSSRTVLFATVHAADDRTPARKVAAFDTGDLFTIFADHLAGKAIPASTTAVQVPRLELIGSDRPLLPTYWVAKAHPPTADQLHTAITEARTAIHPLPAVGNELDALTLNAEKTVRTIPASKLAGLKNLPRPMDEDLVAGDICIGPTQTAVCNVDGQRPTPAVAQVIRCDLEVVDPWFLAGIIDAFRRSGAIPSRTGIPHVDLRLIDVPNINIAEQRALGAALKTLHQRRRQAEEQAQRWQNLEKAVADALATGLATTQ